MKINVFIIGFKYTESKISCMLYDIYRVYKYFSLLNYSCHILTDINDFTYTTDMYNSILKNQIDEEFTDFVGEIRYKPSWYKKVINITSFTSAIDSIKTEDITIVYYSGHGISDSILLPSGEKLSHSLLRDIFISKTLVELTIILDCCKGSSMDLIYYMDNKSKYYKAKKSGTIFTIPITIVTSSDTDQKSIANHYTSLFTKYFIEFLQVSDERSFYNMIEYIESNMLGHEMGDQNVKVYSSEARYPIMPSYFFLPYYLNINILNKYITMEKCE